LSTISLEISMKKLVTPTAQTFRGNCLMLTRFGDLIIDSSTFKSLIKDVGMYQLKYTAEKGLFFK
jgi:hypothetical protein